MLLYYRHLNLIKFFKMCHIGMMFKILCKWIPATTFKLNIKIPKDKITSGYFINVLLEN